MCQIASLYIYISRIYLCISYISINLYLLLSSGSKGAWVGDIKCVGDGFPPLGPIMRGTIVGQYPSHWIATARSQKEVDVHGVVTLKVEGGGTYTAHIHEYIKFWEPCVKIKRHFWKVRKRCKEYIGLI